MKKTRILLCILFAILIPGNLVAQDHNAEEAVSGLEKIASRVFGPTEGPQALYNENRKENETFVGNVLLPDTRPTLNSIGGEVARIVYGSNTYVLRTCSSSGSGKYGELVVSDTAGNLIRSEEILFPVLFAYRIGEKLEHWDSNKNIEAFRKASEALEEMDFWHGLGSAVDVTRSVTSKVLASGLTGGASSGQAVARALGTEGLRQVDGLIARIEVSRWSERLNQSADMLEDYSTGELNAEQRFYLYATINDLSDRMRAVKKFAEGSFPGNELNMAWYLAREFAFDLAGSTVKAGAKKAGKEAVDLSRSAEAAANAAGISASMWTASNALTAYGLLSAAAVGNTGTYYEKVHTTDQSVSFLDVMAEARVIAAMASKRSDPSKGPSIGFVLDSSGSMAKNDPKGLRKSAVKIIAGRLEGEESLFLVDFDSSARWLNKDAWSGWTVDEIGRIAEGIDSSGNTDIGAGLSRIKAAMMSSGTVDNGGILLLSDGIGKYDDEAAWFRSMRIPIYTVSFAGDANAQLLQKIANYTGGEYFKARDDNDIVQAFTSFLNRVTGRSLLIAERTRIEEGDRKKYGFIVDSKTKDINSLVSWRGSTVRLTLTSPTGKKYRSGGNGSWRSGDRYTSARIDTPDAGRWTAELYGADIPRGGESVRLEVSSDAPKVYSLEGAQAGSGQVKLQLSSEEQEKAQVREADIRVVRPDGSVKTLSDSLQDGYISYWPDAGAGTYTIEVGLRAEKATGAQLQRFYSRSILVGDVPPPNVGAIIETLGGYLRGNIGTERGNRAGVGCTVLRKIDGSYKKVAEGYVTRAAAGKCTIEIQRYTGYGRPKTGDRLELDRRQWQND